MRVRLGQRAGDSLEPRRQHHRPCDVTAGSEHDVGLPAAEDPTARGRSGERPPHRAHELGARTPRETGDGEGVELVALLRNEPRLDAIRRPGEGHQSAASPQRLRDGHRRRDVSDRPAGRDQEPQLPLVRHYGRC